MVSDEKQKINPSVKIKQRNNNRKLADNSLLWQSGFRTAGLRVRIFLRRLFVESETSNICISFAYTTRKPTPFTCWSKSLKISARCCKDNATGVLHRFADIVDQTISKLAGIQVNRSNFNVGTREKHNTKVKLGSAMRGGGEKSVNNICFACMFSVLATPFIFYPKMFLMNQSSF